MARRKERSSMLPEAARPGKKGGGRPAQVGQAVKQVLGELLNSGGIKDPRLEGRMVTITDVEMTNDLAIGRVFFSVFPEDEKVCTEVLKGLMSASPRMKRAIADELQLRHTPSLEFRLDKSLAHGARIEQLLREIKDSEPDGDG
jgi:ribosome-binding factor A